jgi:hypothetical protein
MTAVRARDSWLIETTEKRSRKNFRVARAHRKSVPEQSQLRERAEEIVECGNKCCAHKVEIVQFTTDSGSSG